MANDDNKLIFDGTIDQDRFRLVFRPRSFVGHEASLRFTARMGLAIEKHDLDSLGNDRWTLIRPTDACYSEVLASVLALVLADLLDDEEVTGAVHDVNGTPHVQRVER